MWSLSISGRGLLGAGSGTEIIHEPLGSVGRAASPRPPRLPESEMIHSWRADPGNSNRSAWGFERAGHPELPRVLDERRKADRYCGARYPFVSNRLPPIERLRYRR